MKPTTHLHDWGILESNIMIKRVQVIDSSGRTVMFQRVQKNSNSDVSWYNVDYPVMDEYLYTWDFVVKYDGYSIVGFYPNGQQPEHVCGPKTADKCGMCLYESVGSHAAKKGK